MEPLDLTAYVRPGDLVVWGQACAEPRTLTRALVAQADRIGHVRCFVGIPAESEVAGELPEALEVVSYCGSGSNAALYAVGRLDVVPVHYSSLPALLSDPSTGADVVLVQVSRPNAAGEHSLGLADDYFAAALDSARVVIAEVNDHVPFTTGARTLTEADWTVAVRSSEPPATMPEATPTDQQQAVARQVAALVPDGATLQVGIGGLPAAVLDALHDHRDLGFHTGIFGDAARRLVESGAATGALKTDDRGVAVAGLLGGSRALFDWADRNPALAVRGTAYTHDPVVLARAHRLTAVNAALEVDLTGQVNAEAVRGRYVGAVGGAIDFLRGAAASPGGVPIVALPSTVRGASTIVPRLSGPTSTPRAEGVVVVTEHGAADLRGLTLRQRVARMIAIADPDYRDALAAQATTV